MLKNRKRLRIMLSLLLRSQKLEILPGLNRLSIFAKKEGETFQQKQKG